MSKLTGEQLDEDMPMQRFFERMVEQSVDDHIHWSLKDFVLALRFEVCKCSKQDRMSNFRRVRYPVEQFSASKCVDTCHGHVQSCVLQ